MRLFEFLRDLEAFYPLNESEEKVDKRIASYAEIIEGEIIKKGGEYDFSKMLRHIQTHYTFKTFPSVPYLLELLPDFKIKNISNVKNEGELVIMTLPNGKKYAFTVTNFGLTDKNIEEKAKRKWGYVDIKRYPKGTVLIGNEVYEGG